MATKAELQSEHEQCERIRRGVSAAELARDYPLAVKHAESALPHQHASVSFQRRYLKLDTPTAPAVEAILRYAPAYFLGRSIDAVQAWYEAGTKTERASLPDMPERVKVARQALAHAVVLWGALAEQPAAVLRPPATSLTATVLPVWLSARVIAVRPKEPSTYVRVCDPRREAAAKCTGCGQERRAPLASLLEPTVCPACEQRCAFVITRRV